jgi:UDP-glucuronate decarboxylase
MKERRADAKATNRRVLVTGGAGFLGSHLCETLLAHGDHVVCADNFVTGHTRNIEHLLVDPNFDLLRQDVTKPFAPEVDEIYNLACPASPPAYQLDPIQTTKTSVLGALNLLELASNRGIRIFQASTSEVYGDPHVHPQPETYWGNVNPSARAPATMKVSAAPRRCSTTTVRSRGVDIKIARIFNTYGPECGPTTVASCPTSSSRR